MTQQQEKRFYNLVMFSYPSGDKLHLGHWYNYAPADSYSRFKKLQGFEVFQPMGFDSFGLPAENYAIKTGIHPAESTRKNMDQMRNQLINMGALYDWKAYLETSDPTYYQWTQWLFVQLFRKGLAYKKKATVNWCMWCNTVLANEQCRDDRCERCGEKVINKELDQWFFKITEYKDRMLSGLDNLKEWPPKTIALQRYWLTRLHDWCISRQRYWGAPIPIVYDPEGEPHAVDGPWKLPTDVDFKPDGQSPLERSDELRKRVTEQFGEGWTPEYDTMDTFVDSSFYFIQYLRNDGKILKDWLPVDLCVGGVEHADKHLIYARFITMFLNDIGVCPVTEPFKKVVHQGIIKNKGEKMAKSKGNAVDPDEYVNKYGSDALRLHLMFMGPYDQGGEWNDRSIVGMKRFLESANRKLDLSYKDACVPREAMNKLLTHVTQNIEEFKFNLAIANFMKFIKSTGDQFMQKRDKLDFIIALAPLAPKTATLMWSAHGGEGNLWQQSWPHFETVQKDNRDFIIQVNGKVKGKIKLSGSESELDIINICSEHIKLKSWSKKVLVPNRLINFVNLNEL